MSVSGGSPAASGTLSRGEVALAVIAVALAAASAHAAFAREGAGAVSLPPAAAAALAAAFTPLAAALEAAAYGVSWRAFGRPYTFGLAWVGTLALTMLESLSLPLVLRAHAEPSVAGSIAWLAGARALGGEPGSGLAFAFAGTGLLAAARMALTAHVQSRAARVRWRGALVVVLAGWLLTRLILWWTVDLVMGRSLGVSS